MHAISLKACDGGEMATKGWWGYQNELMKVYERNKNQSTDDKKRVAIAMYLDHEPPADSGAIA